MFAVAAALAPALSAGYSNLIATSDGNAVYLQAKTGFVLASWYVVQNSGFGPALYDMPNPWNLPPPYNGPVADVSATGTALAFASYGDRFCGNTGSRCLVEAPCAASWALRTGAQLFAGANWRTFARLDRAGAYLWIEQ